MASFSRRNGHRELNAWPGWVDALSSLVMVVIFLLMVFVVAQFYLATALTGRDEQLQSLSRKVAELNDLLTMERDANADLRVNIAQMSDQLQSSVATREDLTAAMGQLQDERDATAREAASLAADIKALREMRQRLEGEVAERAAALRLTEEQRQALLAQLGTARDRSKELEAKLADSGEKTMLAQKEIALRDQQIAALNRQIAEATDKADATQKDIAQAQKDLTLRNDQIDTLNKQIAALRDQLARIGEALNLSEKKASEQQVQIADLGARLNQALASKVQELARYRSEFFGRMREALGTRQDIRIVGDRFVFQSDILFPSASAELQEAGKRRMADLAQTLIELGKTIPSDINWVLRVDGHTDSRPITRTYASNWELSAARAIAVVKFLIEQGIPAERLVAAGFGEWQPLDSGTSEEALARNRRIEIKFDQR
ncbi:peptidoglycan -binding protein [Azospirillum sp.]|uniref:peptidoglycan -binding protein n=1 Tax=Azospirillum sp. TaxID=34012 RepID=UPI003D71BF06